MYMLSKKVNMVFRIQIKVTATYYTMENLSTVFPQIVVATTILFLRLRCDKYSREETIQRRKLLFSWFSEVYIT